MSEGMSLLPAFAQESKLVVDPDRRRSIRVEPPAESPLPAKLRSVDGKWDLTARSCHNVGLGGVAVRLSVDEAATMRLQEFMDLTLHLAGGVSYELRVRVCYVNEMGPQDGRPFQVGLQFMPAPHTCAAVVEIYGYLSNFTELWR